MGDSADLLQLQAPDGARATLSLLGGQLLSWITPDGLERFYLSPQAMGGSVGRHAPRRRRWLPKRVPCSTALARRTSAKAGVPRTSSTWAMASASSPRPST